MFGSVILDVGVGLVLIYLLLSLVATSIREALAGMLNTRGTTLRTGLMELFENEEALVEDLYDHPLIASLYRGKDYATAKGKKALPAYIPARSFAAALTDMIVRGRGATGALQASSEAAPITVEAVREEIGRIANVRVQRAILAAVDASKGDLELLYANIEHWFDSTMDRVSGWYKRHTQMYLFFIGLALTALANADSVRIAKRLYTDPSARQTAIALASTLKSSDTIIATGAALDSARSLTLRRTARQLDSLDVPLYGWSELDQYPTVGAKAAALGDALSLSMIVGWIITALAVSLGAPFWFDTLGKIMIIRSTVKPTQKSPNEASEDRQPSSVTGAGAAAATPRLPSPGAGVAAPAPASRAAAVRVSPPAADDFTPREWEMGHPNAGVL